jgi:integrase
MCHSQFPSENRLTEKICLAWAVRGEAEGNDSFRNRLMPVREFAKYLLRTGEAAYILPADFVKRSARPVPYIYSETEVANLWSYFDNLKPLKLHPMRHIEIPAIMRILYCCGLRPCEALKLRVQDVDLNKGKLYIMESKGYKDRSVMMSDDVTEYCRGYNTQASVIMPNRKLFFPNVKGEKYSATWLLKPFRAAKKACAIGQSGNCVPRVYDLRHTFATHRLYKWMKEGKDITAKLPYLSAYMGHTELSDTLYYIHMVPGLFEMMSGFDYSVFEYLLPEVEYDA